MEKIQYYFHRAGPGKTRYSLPARSAGAGFRHKSVSPHSCPPCVFAVSNNGVFFRYLRLLKQKAPLIYMSGALQICGF